MSAMRSYGFRYGRHSFSVRLICGCLIFFRKVKLKWRTPSETWKVVVLQKNSTYISHVVNNRGNRGVALSFNFGKNTPSLGVIISICFEKGSTPPIRDG